jgi:hypothetical protein
MFSDCNPGPVKRAATIITGLNNISYLKIAVVADNKKISLLKYCITYKLPYILLKYFL